MEETSKRKKKGRPSLLDLQKRNLKEQQQHHNSNSDPHSTLIYESATATRRSTRRNPNPDEEEDDESELEKRREKKLKLLLKLPQDHNSDQIDDKRSKINPIGDGSDAAKGQSNVSGANPTSYQQGAQVDLGPSTPLPDTKLLLFILDRLQKKDTYSVFSEPVDPKELPDYHEIIEHPMDFSTVKKKLAGGAYATLEHFEKDIFLICANAMQYNSPNTIYFRQARSIQELAIKNFENLRQDSDDNEPERKVVRRGRPPTKHLKKPLGRPPLERTGAEFSDATPSTGGVNIISSNYDMRKGARLDQSGFTHTSHNTDPNWLAQNKFDKNDELSGSMLKGNSMKLGKNQFIPDENRRHTYKQFHPSAGGREPSVLATFSVERKQLMAVGLHSEQGYARSLALFAASLGPVAWKMASKRIERSLSVGVKFGPGWVGENDILPRKQLVLPALPLSQLSSSQSLPVAGDSVDCIEDELPQKQLPLPLPPTSEPMTKKSEASAGLNGTRPSVPFPVEQGHVVGPGMNGINLPAQRPIGISFHSSQVADTESRSDSKLVHEATMDIVLNSEEPKHAESRSEEVKAGNESESSSPRSGGHEKPSRDRKPKSDLASPDLNIRFQSPGSPRMKPDLALQL